MSNLNRDKTKAISLRLFLLAIVIASPASHLLASTTLPAAEYFPLQVGNEWQYRSSHGDTDSLTFTGTALVNGATTFVLSDQFNDQVFFTNDANGFRRHREHYPSDGIDVVYSPPLKHTNANIVVGETVSSSGTANVTISGIGTFSLSYTASTTAQAIETVTVPAGTFAALRARLNIRVFGSFPGGSLDETQRQTDWLARNIGPVKELIELSDGNEILELLSTNVGRSPGINESAVIDVINRLIIIEP